jgi:aromatic-L-amino-acid decarboxylase
VDGDPEFERLAAVPFSVVCFRWKPADASDEELDRANAQLMDAVNATGEMFLSHTRIRGRLALRLAIGHADTREQHVRGAWDLLRAHAARSRQARDHRPPLV